MTYLALMKAIASSTSFTGTIGSTGPKISLPAIVQELASTYTSPQKRGETHSLNNESSPLTSRTTVGAMYLVPTSAFPPRKTVPLVSSMSFLIRAVCAVVTIRENDSDFSGPSG